MKPFYIRLKATLSRDWTVLLSVLILLPLAVGVLVGFWSGSRISSLRPEEVTAAVEVRPVPQPAPNLGASGGQPRRGLEYTWTTPKTSGQDVRKLQSRLLALAGQAGREGSGEFDLSTQRGIFEFQVRGGLPPTGRVDAATWATLFGEEAR